LRGLRPAAWIVALACALTVLPVSFAAAQAQNFPNHPIKIIIGPSPDIFSRIVAEHLQQAWGQPVVVEPRPGGGGKLAVTAVSSAAPDGHTLLFATPTYTLNTAMQVASYDLLKEFEPVSIIGVISYVLVTHSSVPATSVAELVAYARQNKLNCASAGIGTVPHLACEYLNKLAGTSILHVPYRDVNSATMATVGNVTQMFFGVSTSAKSQIDSGTLRGLAVSTAQRSLLLPALPTMMESGYPPFDMPGWGGLLAPARTPADIVEKLNGEVRRAVERSEAAYHGRHGAAATPEPGGVPQVYRERHRALDAIRRRGRSREAQGRCSTTVNMALGRRRMYPLTLGRLDAATRELVR
jgi:tripartite-type tricarboxylate transporter receptor subunit TctC